MLCLHTAGPDTRQWRHLMNDAEVTRDHRLIAFVYSRVTLDEHEYVQDRLLKRSELVAELLRRSTTHLYACGLKELEAGVDTALGEVCGRAGLGWEDLRAGLREEGRMHVEIY